MKKLVIFDLDGTLLNTIDDIRDSFNMALNELGFREATTEEMKYFVGSGVDNLVKRAIKKILGGENCDENINKYHSLLKEKYQFYYEQYQKNKTRLYDGILDLILNLKKENVKVAVLSNKPDNDVKAIIKYYFNDVEFDYVQGSNTEVGIKPAILGVNKILSELNIYNKKEVLFVGDSDVDVLTAINASIDSAACLWGFRKKEELMQATFLVSNTKELYEVIVNGL